MDKALLVGINKYPGSPLAGCVNDVVDMADWLVKFRNFDPKSVRLLIDGRATTSAIRTRLHWLVEGLKPGDRILFHYSGHGAQVATRDKQGEVDGKDEVVCIAKGTKIPLLDGSEIAVEELAERSDPFWVYSIDSKGNFCPGLAKKAWKTGSQKKVFRVGLDNGEVVLTTPEHLWMLRDGSYKKAAELLTGDSLMPLYRGVRRNKNKRGYETVYNPATNEDVETHRVTIGECSPELKERSKEQNCGLVRHHLNFKSMDNRPENLVWMTWKDHVQLHSGSAEFRKEAGERLKARWADPEYRCRMKKLMSENAKKREISPELRRAKSEAAKKQDLTAFRKGAEAYNRKRMLELWQDPEYREKMIIAQSQEKPGTSEALKLLWKDPEYKEKMRKKQSESMKARWKDPEKRKLLHNGNHKVVFVEEAGFSDVYDLSVPAYENFAVSAGVFLHNCPVDFDWSDRHLIRDKEIHQIFDKIPEGVVACFVSDSCHSGDLTRDLGGLGGRVARRLVPPEDIAWRMKAADFHNMKVKGMSRLPNITLISGCRSDQTSADASFNGRSNGALTYFLLDNLRKESETPMSKLILNVRKALESDNYDQIPQLEGPENLLNKAFLK
jgi:hypothetical protein